MSDANSTADSQDLPSATAILTTACLLAIPLICCGVFGCPKGATVKNPPATPTNPAPSGASAGRDVYLAYGPNPSLVWLAIDEAAHAEMTRRSTARDVTGLELMEASGRIFSVPHNSQARVTDAGFFSQAVRVKSGLRAGQEGIISPEFCHASPR